MIIQPQSATQVELAQNFCELCGHHRVHHFKMTTHLETTPCRHQMGTEHKWDCRCLKFCGKFEPKEEGNGLTCKHCGEEVFSHIEEQRKLRTLTASHPQRLAQMTEGDIPYKVIDQAMKLCCLWTIRRVMDTSSDEEIKLMLPGYAVECPICAKAGRIEVVVSPFVVGPTWQWKYKGT